MTEAVVLSMPGLSRPESPAELTPRQKAAVLVLQLGREACAPVLAELSERELERRPRDRGGADRRRDRKSDV